jgi:hypothetical protein
MFAWPAAKASTRWLGCRLAKYDMFQEKEKKRFLKLKNNFKLVLKKKP